MRAVWLLALLLAAPVLAGCLGDPEDVVLTATDDDTPAYEPHVIVGVPDSGINPYHQLYFRENRTAHPCTYVRDIPCDLPALNLTLGGTDYDAAFEADKELWDNVEPGTAYWIPQTVFVAVMCQENQPEGDICILDDSGMHGTGTTSSVITENPDALLAFKEGGSGIAPLVEAGIPVDIFSVSWGYIAPIPAAGPVGKLLLKTAPLYVKAAGNTPWSSYMTHWSGYPGVISVGGAYAEGTEEAMATKQPDIVSYYCRPTAQTKEVEELRESYCGTSFAAPTAAGALSKVVLELRRSSGYDGSVDAGMVDPILGISTGDLRDAMNATATYAPEAQYDNDRITGVPLNPVAPWVQWGWGFYDGLVAETTVHFLLHDAPAPAKGEAAAYMDAQHTVKTLLYG